MLTIFKSNVYFLPWPPSRWCPIAAAAKPITPAATIPPTPLKATPPTAVTAPLITSTIATNENCLRDIVPYWDSDENDPPGI